MGELVFVAMERWCDGEGRARFVVAVLMRDWVRTREDGMSFLIWVFGCRKR